MASDGSPYDGPGPRPTVVKPNGPYGAVRSAPALDGAASAVMPSPATPTATHTQERRMFSRPPCPRLPRSGLLHACACSCRPRAAGVEGRSVRDAAAGEEQLADPAEEADQERRQEGGAEGVAVQVVGQPCG